MVDLIDSYDETNHDNWVTLAAIHPTADVPLSGVGQSFTMIAAARKIVSCKFYLKQVGNPGIMNAVLYDHAGVYGTSSVPSGAALGTSNDVDASGIGGNFILVTFSFAGAQQYLMTANANYCIVVQATSGDWDAVNNNVLVSQDISAPSHSGNRMVYQSSAWAPKDTRDIIFYVYGEAAGGPSLKRMLMGVGLMAKTPKFEARKVCPFKCPLPLFK